MEEKKMMVEEKKEKKKRTKEEEKKEKEGKKGGGNIWNIMERWASEKGKNPNLSIGHSEPTPTSAPWRMNGKWSG